MTHQSDLERVALAAAKEGSRETMAEIFSLMGVNIANFDSMDEFRKDIAFIRSLRGTSSKVGSRVVVTLFTMFSVAIALSMWKNIVAIIKH